MYGLLVLSEDDISRWQWWRCWTWVCEKDIDCAGAGSFKLEAVGLEVEAMLIKFGVVPRAHDGNSQVQYRELSRLADFSCRLRTRYRLRVRRWTT
jgi:hypothetical protein